MDYSDINNNKYNASNLNKNIHIITDQLIATSLLINSNSTLPAHAHDENDEIIYVVRGEGEITIDDETESLQNGMIISIPRTKSHQITTADSELLILSFSKIKEQRRNE